MIPYSRVWPGHSNLLLTHRMVQMGYDVTSGTRLERLCLPSYYFPLSLFHSLAHLLWGQPGCPTEKPMGPGAHTFSQQPGDRRPVLSQECDLGSGCSTLLPELTIASANTLRPSERSWARVTQICCLWIPDHRSYGIISVCCFKELHFGLVVT